MKPEKELQPSGQWRRPGYIHYKSIKMDNCRYCGSHCSLTKDHIQPRSRGGNSHQSNLQPLCLYCNQHKGNKTELELFLIFQDIIERGVWYKWEEKYASYLKWLLIVQKERGVENCKVTHPDWYNSSYSHFGG